MPDFSKKAEKPKKKQRAPTRELLGSAGRRISLPVRSSISVRAQFHNVPIELPPPPDPNVHVQVASEHAYASLNNTI